MLKEEVYIIGAEDEMGRVARMGEKRTAYGLSVGKPERKETTRKTKT
jgi:hypothetical protein